MSKKIKRITALIAAIIVCLTSFQWYVFDASAENNITYKIFVDANQSGKYPTTPTYSVSAANQDAAVAEWKTWMGTQDQFKDGNFSWYLSGKIEDSANNIVTLYYTDLNDYVTTSKTLTDVLPDANGNYTINFDVSGKTLATLSGESNKIYLVVDRSLSMVQDINDAENADDIMAETYEKTRWATLRATVDKFLSAVLYEGGHNQVSLITYAKTATLVTFGGSNYTSDATAVTDALDDIFDKEKFDAGLAAGKVCGNDTYYRTKNTSKAASWLDSSTIPWVDVDFLATKDASGNLYSGLEGGTNIAQALSFVDKLYNELTVCDYASVFLLTDGIPNRDYTLSGTSTGKTNTSGGVSTAADWGNKLKNTDNLDIYSIAMLSTEDVSDVETALGKVTYAKDYLMANNAEQINAFKDKIVASYTVFDFGDITDTLDSNFVLADAKYQSDDYVINNLGAGKYSIHLKNKINLNKQSYQIVVKPKDEKLTGLSYTNNGCKIDYNAGDDATVTYSADFKQTPQAIITPSASDDTYNTTMNVAVSGKNIETENDNNVLVKNGSSSDVKLVVEPVANTALYTISKNGTTNTITYRDGAVATLKEDGTYTFTPATDVIGTYSFDYTVRVDVAASTVDLSSFTAAQLAQMTASATVTTVVANGSFPVTVEYYKDGAATPFTTESLGNKEFGTKVNATDVEDKTPTGYEADTTAANTTLPYTVKSSNNVINVYYVKDSYPVTVEYYKDGETTAFATADLGKHEYASQINATDIENKAPIGYVVDNSAANTALPYTVKESGNVIKVYYTKNNYPVKVNYFKDGETTAFATEELGNKSYGTKINATDVEDKTPTGYKLDTTAANTALPYTVDAKDNVINVYYTKDSYPVKVNYYKDGKLFTSESLGNKEFGSVVKNEDVKDLTPVNYKVDNKAANTELPYTVKASDNVINVYYVQEKAPITVQYYIDGVENKELGYTFTDLIGAKITSVIDKKPEGYKIDEAQSNALPYVVKADGN